MGEDGERVVERSCGRAATANVLPSLKEGDIGPWQSGT